ncbi:MAG: hypothetical protein ACRD36_01330, partial [Candidatus Acidiferrum sp.]
TQIVKDGATGGPILDFLKWDVTAAAYWLRPERLGNVFIIGGGGGRDMLTARQFGARDVDVVELNPAVVAASQQAFAEFSGRPYDLPVVHLTLGEARSELSRRNQQYDLMQMSMIDTWASSMSGSLVMTENSLYTEEAYRLFLSRLKPDGILSVSRWYSREQYGELGRVLALMGRALRSAGVVSPAEHIAVVHNQGYLDQSVVTCVMKRSPFTAAERTALVELCGRMQFTLLWPEVAGVTKHDAVNIAGILADDPAVLTDGEFDLTPPSDERPFFFNTRRPLLSWLTALRTGDSRRGNVSTVVLGGVLLLLLVASFSLVVRPLRQYYAAMPQSQHVPSRNLRWPILYFAGIGGGFMLIEVALIQRYIVFLGHPTYAVSVVLFTLLLFSGVGSSLTDRLGRQAPRRIAYRALIGIGFGIVLTMLLVPVILLAATSWQLPARVALAVTLIAPLSICMGMIYPLGVRLLARADLQEYVPCLWGINGVGAVAASPFAMLLAMNLGYSMVLIAALLCYALTLTAVLWQRSTPNEGLLPTPMSAQQSRMGAVALRD